jgi:hypothetical protein
VKRILLVLAAAGSLATAGRAGPPHVQVTRLPQSPIIVPEMLPGDDGASINGPSLIRVPSWVQHPLGRYYLYFAHHAGKYIRLAYADDLGGPWHVREGGVQPLAAQHTVRGHIASPEAVIDEASRRIYLFYHGGNPVEGKPQATSVSVSTDGLNFTPIDVVVGPAYLRVFRHAGHWYSLNQSGELCRAAALGQPFQPVARIIGPEIADAVDPARLGEPGAPPADTRPKSGPDRYSIRHIGLDVDGDRLVIFFSCVGHRPERILCTFVDLHGPEERWKARGVVEVAQPEGEAEGASLPQAYSNGGISRTRVHELRDPTVFREGGHAWLLYSVAGEHGIGITRLTYALAGAATTNPAR